ncbi:MAG: plastocyanin/azurin family copper-binding protein [Acidimicrobiia bacterium]
MTADIDVRCFVIKTGKLVIVAVAATAAMLAACGGDDEAAEPTVEGPGGDTIEISVAMIEFEYDPVTMEVPAGAEVTVTAANEGSIEHDFVMVDQGHEVVSEDDLPDDIDQFRVDSAVVALHAEPGEFAEGTFIAPDPGDYQVICLVPGHFSAGMEATFTVTG